ncbi:MAG: GNAT family N-acetyltransferase [Litorilinea sp.]
MTVKRATLEHLVEVRALVRHGRRAYIDFGLEDLPDMLGRGTAVVGMNNGQIWGAACVQVEERPTTLPRSAPTRAHLRCIAVQQGHPASARVYELVTGLIHELTDNSRQSLLLVSYGMYDWVCQGLARANFDLLDTVEFFELDRLRARLADRPPPLPNLSFHPAEPGVFPRLAALDAAAFPPLWHFGERELMELCLRCQLQVAYLSEPQTPTAQTAIDGDLPAQPVGYAAVCYNSRDEAQLARLAVDPVYQGRGIGRALLWDAIAGAVATKHRALVLNTQRANQQSQRLYVGMGFRPIGESLPVLGRMIGT